MDCYIHDLDSSGLVSPGEKLELNDSLFLFLVFG